MVVLLILNDGMLLDRLNEQLHQQRFEVFSTTRGQLFPAWCDNLEKIMLMRDTGRGFHLMPPRDAWRSSG
jgi:hypothetical protein